MASLSLDNMANTSLQNILLSALRDLSQFCSEDGILLKNKIIAASHNLTPDLLRVLLREPALKHHFFSDVDGTMVFDKVKFQRFVSNKNFLADSFTAYKNHIGLSTLDGQDFISESNEVVLTWPYKDCVLEGGQGKEDAKRDEIFYNETLAPDEINRLTEPKALSSFCLFDRNGKHEVENFTNQNLFIRGNNLLALHSLLPIYQQEIKTIFIDPPYNTGNDSFGYNDRFLHSAWCTFMLNRLKLAHQLLRKDGSLCISIDHNEIAYCIAIADSIFGRENLKNIITVKRGSVTGAKVINPGVVNLSDYVLIYAKDGSQWAPNKVLQAKERDDRYNQYIVNIEEPYENWHSIPLTDAFAASKGIAKSKLKKELGEIYESEITKFVIDNANRVMRFAALDENSISEAAKKLKRESLDNPNKVFFMNRVGKNPYFVQNGQLMLFVNDRLINIGGELSFGQPISDIWNDVLPNDLHNEGGVVFRKGKKPEKMLHRIIELTSNPGDIVLDFFSGSGTTCAVALKTGRRFIGIEQIDYGKNDSVQRLINTIGSVDSSAVHHYDTRGVSSLTNWQGGGSFVYCELAKANAKYIDEIEVAQSDADLASIWNKMKDSAQLSYKVKIKDIDPQSEDFTALSFEDKKRFLIACLDKNMLYVPFSEMDNAEYGVSEKDRKLSKLFYSKV